MIEPLLADLQASAFAETMRSAVYLYPLANLLHVLGAMCFFAAVAAMDVKLLSAVPRAEVRAFIAKVRPAAILGFLVQAVTGAMLLAPEATHIGHNPAFRIKVASILLGLVNVAIVEIALRRRPNNPRAGRISAVVSLLAWLGAAAGGRLIAYF